MFAFQRMRRIAALKEELESLGVDYSGCMGEEGALRELLERALSVVPDLTEEEIVIIDLALSYGVDIEGKTVEQIKAELLENEEFKANNPDWYPPDDQKLLIEPEKEPEKEPEDIVIKEAGPFNKSDEAEEEAVKARAKELKIKSWHLKSVETLKAEIAELEKGTA